MKTTMNLSPLYRQRSVIGVLGVVAALTGAALPAVVGIAAISAGAVYFLDPQK